jgi:TolB-like protein
MKRSLICVAAIATAMAFVSSPAVAQTGAPVVAVLSFDNNSIGKDAKDFEGIGKGVTDLLITDLASTGKVRVVDRSRIEQILAEQNLTKSGAIDAESAAKVGKLLGACYTIWGGFMRDLKGGNVLTAHSTSVETGRIENPEKVMSNGDDVMQLIAQLSSKLQSDMKLNSCTGGMSRSASAAPAQQGKSAAPATASAPVSAAAPTAAPAVTYHNALAPKELDKLHTVKLDARTMLLYSRALDAEDHQDKAKAIELLKQVVAKAPTFDPANSKLASLQSKAGD